MALNQLQYMSLSMSVIKYDDIRQRLLSSSKDEDISPFTAVDKYGFLHTTSPPCCFCMRFPLWFEHALPLLMGYYWLLFISNCDSYHRIKKYLAIWWFSLWFYPWIFFISTGLQAYFHCSITSCWFIKRKIQREKIMLIRCSLLVKCKTLDDLHVALCIKNSFIKPGPYDNGSSILPER